MNSVAAAPWTKLAAALVGAWFVGASCAPAQSPAPLDGTPAQAAGAELGQTHRQQQFDQLNRDVDAMERELSIYKRVVKLVASSVVHVHAAPLPEFQFRREVEEAGSGVIVRIGPRDWVLTNRHVIRHSDVDHIQLELNDGRQLLPRRILEDPETDVAVMAIDGADLTPARLGNSDAAEIGEIVMAFGSPFNLRQSVTRGIISAKGRSNLDLGDGEVGFQNFMQTDAAINPGNSGGPLVNLRGEVIGINTAIASNSGGNDGIGFSIPINIAVGVMRQLVEKGRIDRGFLGVTLDHFFDGQQARDLGLTRLTGAHVKSVVSRSPAEQAGLRVDDVILRFNGATIDNDDQFHGLVKLAEIGQQIDLVVFRDRRTQVIRAQIGRPQDFAGSAGAR